MQIRVYNTKTGRKEPITYAPHRNQLLLYTCGPTVYNFAHIGNLRAYVFEDLFLRTLKFFGFVVKHAMNLTDIDDKTIRGANERGVELNRFTQFYKRAFFEDLKTLEIQPAHQYPSATEYIPHMISMIQTLLEKGIAYQTEEGSVYFSIDRFPSYGALSHLAMRELKVGGSNRVTSDEYEKKCVADFALWKRYDPKRDGAIFWNSPFGKGRPGWHIECSAMAGAVLGKTIDIHMGGVYNIFPHHENEIAQSEGCHGQLFTRFWVHVNHLIVDGKKMSKSLNNFYTLRDLLNKGYSGAEIRYLLLSTHYRTKLNFTIDGLNAARHSLGRLANFVDRLHQVKEGSCYRSRVQTAQLQFGQALGDDLNISRALAVLFDFVRRVNLDIDRGAVTDLGASEISVFLQSVNDVLGCIPMGGGPSKWPQEVQIALEKRQEARNKKDWVEADKHRDYIESQGYKIEDDPSGPRLKKIKP